MHEFKGTIFNLRSEIEINVGLAQNRMEIRNTRFIFSFVEDFQPIEFNLGNVREGNDVFITIQIIDEEKNSENPQKCFLLSNGTRVLDRYNTIMDSSLTFEIECVDCNHKFIKMKILGEV